MKAEERNIYPVFERLISREVKEEKLNQRAKAIWLTGLSGSGKTTVAVELEKKLFALGFFTQVLDGDNVRAGLCNNLGFSAEDRAENIRRIAELNKLMLNCGIICINCFVSPSIAVREQAKNIIGAQDFIEVFINTPLEICEQRDVKGLYKKARAGEIKSFTGIDAPFEAPQKNFIDIRTEHKSVGESADELLDQILEQISLNKA